MKKLLTLMLSLTCTLSLIGCEQTPKETAPPAEDPIIEETAPAEKPEVIPQPGGQMTATHAYEQILSSFGGLLPHDPGYPGYPEEYGGAYYADGYLNLCLTDISEEMKEKYYAMVDTPQHLLFKEVIHSYNDLYALQMAITQIEGPVFTSVGVDEQENQVDVGIPDITKEAETLAFIVENLPQEIKDRFSEYPIVFCEEDFAQPT